MERERLIAGGIRHAAGVVRDTELALYAAECPCGWKSDYLHSDRESAAADATSHNARPPEAPEAPADGGYVCDECGEADDGHSIGCAWGTS